VHVKRQEKNDETKTNKETWKGVGEGKSLRHASNQGRKEEFNLF